MRLLFVVGVCLTLVFVVECLEGKAEFTEDEEEMDQRHLIKRCKSDTDCGSGHCCADNFGLIAKCKRIRRTAGEGQTCSFKSRYCNFLWAILVYCRLEKSLIKSGKLIKGVKLIVLLVIST
ncbi:hypothetical protein ABFA07_004770 [Porites harrisoni]